MLHYADGIGEVVSTILSTSTTYLYKQNYISTVKIWINEIRNVIYGSVWQQLVNTASASESG